MGKTPDGATGSHRSLNQAPDKWAEAITKAKASGDWQDPWRELPALIAEVIGCNPPPCVGSRAEFPSLQSPVYEARRDFRRAHQKFIDAAGDLVRSAEARCGTEFSQVVDPLRMALHEIWREALGDDQDALIAKVRREAEMIEIIAALKPPAGKSGAPETEVDLGTDLFVRAICCFRAERGWPVDYDCSGWKKSSAQEPLNKLNAKAVNDRVHLHMPHETSVMIARCLALWGYGADPAVIAKALKNYGQQIAARGYGPHLDDLILYPTLQSPPRESDESQQ